MKREQVQILANAAKNGDKNALSALFNEFCGRVCFFADIAFGKEGYSVEAACNTFAQAADTVGTIKDTNNFPAWLFGIAYQVCAKHFARKNVFLADEDECACEASEEAAEYIPESSIDINEFSSIICNTVRALGEEPRATVALCGFCGFDIKTVARIQSVSEGTAKNRLEIALTEIGSVCREYCERNSQNCDFSPLSAVKWALALLFGSIPSAAHHECALQVAALLKEKNGVMFTVVADKKEGESIFSSTPHLTPPKNQYSFIFCRSCGNRMASDSIFCTKCGARLKR